MSLYELAIVLHPDLEIDLEKPLAKLEKLLQKYGNILSQEEWGKRKLAYPLKKQQFGLYYFYQLELTPESIVEVERNLTINDEILRHLIVKASPLKPDSDKDKEPTTSEDVAKKPAKSATKTKKPASKVTKNAAKAA